MLKASIIGYNHRFYDCEARYFGKKKKSKDKRKICFIKKYPMNKKGES